MLQKLSSLNFLVDVNKDYKIKLISEKEFFDCFYFDSLKEVKVTLSPSQPIKLKEDFQWSGANIVYLSPN